MWVVSNLYSEVEFATKLLSFDHIVLICDVAQTVCLEFQGENYRNTCYEVLFALCNLITTSEREHLYKVLFTEGGSYQSELSLVNRILELSIKLLEQRKISEFKTLVPQILDMIGVLLSLGPLNTKIYF